MIKKINIAITGSLGRMGQQLIRSAKKNKYFKHL
jgi:dihydrodipicolinate reductase